MKEIKELYNSREEKRKCTLLPQAVCTQVSEYCAIYASKKTCSFLFKKYINMTTLNMLWGEMLISSTLFEVFPRCEFT